MIITARRNGGKMALAPVAAPGVRFYNLAEVAQICQASHYKIRMAIYKGELKAVMRGISYQISSDDLAEYVARHINKTVELP
jgi:excisionase family DNA binding protein